MRRNSFENRKGNLILRVSGIILLMILLSTFTYAATSIELTTGNFINVFGNLNLSGNNLVNAGNVSIRGNLSVAGNLSVGNNVLFVDTTSGGVGIGTTSPQNKLEVIGAVTVAGTLNASSINVTGNAYFATQSGNVGIGTTSPIVRLHVLGDGTNAAAFMNGNVGIGTGNPGQILQLNATAGADSVILFQINGTNNAYVGVDKGNDIITGANAGDVSIRSTNAIRFSPNVDNIAMSITTSGNVGINTTTPRVLLQIGAIQANDATGRHFVIAQNTQTQMRLHTSSDTAGNGNVLEFKRTRGTSSSMSALQNGDLIGEIDWGVQMDAQVDNSPAGAKIDAVVSGGIVSGADPAHPTTLRFWTAGNDQGSNALKERMSIVSTGLVGIGGTSPNVTLSVSGNANVSGRLSYGTLAANSPHFLETAGQAEPLCIKGAVGKYVGCMVDDNFEFKCKIDDRCNRKYLDAKLNEEIEKLNKEISSEVVPVPQLPNNASNNSANKITGNVINEVPLQTDLSSVLSNESTINDSSVVPIPILTNNNLINESSNNGTLNNTLNNSASVGDNTNIISSPIAGIAQSSDINYKKLKIEKLSRIKKEVKEKKMTVKEAISELKPEDLKEVDINEIESEEDTQYTAQLKKGKETAHQQPPQLDYITKVNGSIILRLG